MYYIIVYLLSSSCISSNVPLKIRFRVRTINFTRLTTSFKGVEQTTTSEIHNGSHVINTMNTSAGAMATSSTLNLPAVVHRGLSDAEDLPPAVRRQRSSSSIGITNDENLPAVMQVIGCVNEDGLGLLSWWSS